MDESDEGTELHKVPISPRSKYLLYTLNIPTLTAFILIAVKLPVTIKFIGIKRLFSR